MNFSPKYESLVQKELETVLEHPDVQKMKQFIQHGEVTTYEHCLNVAITSYTICSYLHLHVKTKEMLRGAMLHDLFLYDWHDGRIRHREGLHAFSHPKVALRNANKAFALTKREQNIIRGHMFPATIFHPPCSKEAIIVNVSDKICAFQETFSVGFFRGLSLFYFKKDLLKRKGDF